MKNKEEIIFFGRGGVLEWRREETGDAGDGEKGGGEGEKREGEEQ